MSTIFSVVGEHHPSEQGLHQKASFLRLPSVPPLGKASARPFFLPHSPRPTLDWPAGPYLSNRVHTRSGCARPKSHRVCARPKSHRVPCRNTAPAIITPISLPRPEKSLAQALKESGVPTMRGAPLYLY